MKYKTSNAGMTMIELVSALMLLIFILGGLTLALNKASTLWNSAHTRQNEEEQADLVLNMLTDDLRETVADTGRLKDQSKDKQPTFICDAFTNQTESVLTLLQFVRHRSKNSTFNKTYSKPPFLDAVFYTCYSNMLFRHIAPLEYSDINSPETIGELLEEKYNDINTESSHKEILAYLNDPVNKSKPSGNFSLIASNIEQPLIFGGIKESLVTSDEKTDPPVINAQTDNIPVTTPPVYYKFATSALPEYLDIEIRIFSEKDWNTYQQLIESASEENYNRKNPYLGTYRSKRIYLPTAKAARLP